MTRGSYFAGSALHTNLGMDKVAHLTALQHAPTPPEQVVAHYAGQQHTLPYRLLANQPLRALTTRLDTVLDRLIADVLSTTDLSSAELRRTALFVGTSSFDIGASESHYREALVHYPQAMAMIHSSSQGDLAMRVRHRFGLCGPDYSFNTACTASANALVYADAMIRSGQLDHALVLGVETYNSISALGFNGLQLLTPTAMRPFSPERNGLILGEGCSALMLSHRTQGEHSFRLLASSNYCDTHSVSATRPDGSVIALVMQEALRRAGLVPQDILAIKTHGTASLSNDEAEAAGMRHVFSRMPALTALKPYLGHTLGACGLNELLLFCMAAEQGFLVATPGVGCGDEGLGITLNQDIQDLPRGAFMLNYFGFGGSNTSLIVSNLPEHLR